METKRLSAKGVFEVRKKQTRKQFFQDCEQLDERGKEQVQEDSKKRFWEAKNKINANVYTVCCNILNINPEESKDRSPFELEIKFQEKLNLSNETTIKSTTYNIIKISELKVNLEFNLIVISGKWQGVFRDNYYDLLEQFKLWQVLTTFGEIEIVELDNKKFFEISSAGNFSLSYWLSLQDLKINVTPNNVKLSFNNTNHQLFCDFFTKYNNRITEPLMESGLISSEMLQKIVEQKVGHNFFKITNLLVNESSIKLIIDESYPENQLLVDAELDKLKSK